MTQQQQSWQDKLENTLPTVKLALKITLWLLKLTTLASFAILGYTSLLGKMHHTLVLIAAGLLAYLGSFVIDGLLDRLLPFAGSRIDKSLDDRFKYFHHFIRVVSLLLLVASGTITWWLMPQAAEMAAKKPQDAKYLAAIDSINRRAALSLESISREIQQAQASEKARIRQAEKDGDRLIREAIRAGGPEFARIYNKSSWAKSAPKFRKINQVIAQARDEKKDMIKRERNMVPTLLAQRDQLQTSSLGAANNLTSTLSGQVKKQWDAYYKKLNNITTVLVITDFAWMLLVVILSIALWWVDGFEVKDEKTLLGVMFEAMTSREQQALARAEGWLKGIKKATTAASPPTGASPAPTAPPTAPALVPVRADNSDQIRALEAQVAALQVVLENQATRHADRQPELLSDKGFELSGGDVPAPVAVPVGDIVGDSVALSVAPVGGLAASVTTTDSGQVEIQFDGATYGDTSKFADAARKWYQRQHTSSTPQGKADNKAKWEVALPILEKFYTLEYLPGHKVKMVPLAGEFKPHQV